MVYLGVAVCVALIVIIAPQFIKARQRKGLRLRRDKLGESFQLEWQQYLLFARELLNNKEAAEKAQELNEKFSALEVLLGKFDQKPDAGKLSDAESFLNIIVILLDEIQELKKSDDETSPH